MNYFYLDLQNKKNIGEKKQTVLVKTSIKSNVPGIFSKYCNNSGTMTKENEIIKYKKSPFSNLNFQININKLEKENDHKP